MNPIHFDRRQVALMVAVALHFEPGFSARIGEPAARIAMIAAGIADPTTKALQAFGLKAERAGAVWIPR